MPARVLAIVERGPRSTAEQRSDLIDFCLGLRTSFGSLDLVLCGSAVACALEDSAEARKVRTLMRIGTRVWADQADLEGRGRPIDGVTVADADALAAGWHAYEEVWFL